MSRARLFSVLLLVVALAPACGKKRRSVAPADAAAPMPVDGAFVLSLEVTRRFGARPADAQAIAHSTLRLVDRELHFTEEWTGVPHAYARPKADLRRTLSPDERARVDKQLAESGLLLADAGGALDPTAAWQFALNVKNDGRQTTLAVFGSPDEERREVRASTLLFAQLATLARR